MQHSTTHPKTTTTFVFRVKDILSKGYLLRSTKNVIILDLYHQKHLQIYIMVGMFYIRENQIYQRGSYLRKPSSPWETSQLLQTPLSTTTTLVNNLSEVTGDDAAKADMLSKTRIIIFNFTTSYQE